MPGSIPGSAESGFLLFFREIFEDFETGLGQISDSFRTDFGQFLDKFRTIFGHFWTFFGHVWEWLGDLFRPFGIGLGRF